MRLLDICHAARKILQATEAGKESFLTDEMLQVWVVHHLELIGEAATHVGPEVKQRHPEVDWIAAVYTRNRLIHGYFDVDLAVVWATVERDIPVLLWQIDTILESHPVSGDEAEPA